ncbi:MAG TPA: hypothetical protein VFA74_16100, partial [Terriglobales bacterium]|nr:hypothetical protein [Terriglobales bacterium]
MDLKELPFKLVTECGSYHNAIEAILSFSRSLREVAFLDSNHSSEAFSNHPYYWQVDLSELRRAFKKDSPTADSSIFSTLLHHIRAVGLSADPRHGEGNFRRSVFQPLTLVRELLTGIRPDHDLRYFAMAGMRRKWRRALSSATAHEFQILTDILNSAIELRADYDRKSHSVITREHTIPVLRKWDELKRFYEGHPSRDAFGQGQHWQYKHILEILAQAEHLSDKRDWKAPIQLFLECCFAVYYFQAHASKNKWVVLRTSSIDSAFLLSNLFGVTTAIAGLDDLFGGGGLILADGVVTEESRNHLGGRAVLTLGRYGTGKSLLCMQ